MTLYTKPTRMDHVRAFALGVREFRLTCTTHFGISSLQSSYDWGREWAHRLTFRHYEV